MYLILLLKYMKIIKYDNTYIYKLMIVCVISKPVLQKLILSNFFKRKTGFSRIYRVRRHFYWRENIMFLNYREKPFALLYYTAISARRELTKSEKFQMDNLIKGFEGECLYDEIFNTVGHENLYVLRDLYLNINKSVTQYDSIIVMNNRIVVNEVKNLNGDYRYGNNGWYKNNRQMENDPFIQLSRGRSRLISLRQKSSWDFEVDGNIIFINDDFSFVSDNEGLQSQTVIRSQLKKYFRSFKQQAADNNAKEIVQLIKSTIVENPKLPEPVDITQLKRGLYCKNCISYNLFKGRFQFVCADCGSVESYETHLLRAMFDHKYLFPNQRMTRQSLLHLINYEINKNTVFYALKKHCHILKNGNQTSYTLKYSNLDKQLVKIRNIQRYKDKIINI